MRGVSVMVALGNCSPEMAVPITVKMPEPMTAPMPSAVSDHGPRVFLSACEGSAESLISLSMDLRAKNWLGRAGLLADAAFSYQLSAFSCFGEGCRLGRMELKAESRWLLFLPLRLAADHLLDSLLERASGS